MFISKNMKLEVFTVILLVSSIILIFGVIGPVSAATITVNPGQSIQSAINSASNDDTIIVNNGIYNENIVVNKKITLIANGNVDIIAGDNQNPVITVTASGTVIKNFKLSNSIVGVQYFGTVSNNQLINNIIVGTGTSYGNGISFSTGTASNNLVQGNTISNELHGILFNEGNVNNIVNCNNITLGGAGAGIYSIDGSIGMIITNNYVTNAQDSIACESLNGGLGDGFTIIGNTLTNGINGFWMKLSNSTISYNTVTNCNVSGYDISGINNRIINNTATSNNVVGIIADKWGSSDNIIISGNVLIDNAAGICTSSPGATISNNYVWNNGMGIVSTGGNAVITSNNAGSNSPDYIIQGSSNTQANSISQEYPIPVIKQPNSTSVIDPPSTTPVTPHSSVTVPHVTKTSPGNKKKASRTATIYIQFNQNIYKSVYWSKIYVKNLKLHHLIHINKSLKGHLLTIKTVKKCSNTWYQVVIPSSAIKNIAGTKLSATYKFKFKTT